MPGQISLLKKSSINRICILRLSAIGDVCHAVAMVQHIQRNLPNVEITWVIGKVEAALLADLPGVELVVFDKKAGWQGFKDLKAKFKGQRFDVLLHMQAAFRSSLASLCIPAKIKVGFDRKRAIEGQWLFTNAAVKPIERPHVLDGFFGFAEAIGIPVEPPLWAMPLSETDLVWADEKLSGSKPFAVISPAASKAERNWHVQGYAQAADYLASKGFSVVLCGGPAQSEKSLAEAIIEKSTAEIINLVGQTNLKQMLAVLKHAHLVIAPDTGPAHMAVTVGTPVIGLYAHSNPGRTGPYIYPNYVVSCYEQMIKRQHGNEANQLPWGVRAKGDDLMNNITIEQVMEKIDLLLSEQFPDL